jgi:hypothetical protein
VNAGGTLNPLVAARDFCLDTPFSFTNTRKVCGDRPNDLPIYLQWNRYPTIPNFYPAMRLMGFQLTSVSANDNM